ncbi:hypothetical protein MPF19_04445 [Polaribacter sp. Z014]|uniref:hypothetical protein n=1 Tax=Polaribacter sp. Z014 TaxID=2927126 RepID=UPI00201FFA0F|nr:hypothetical protein [Polaribacter sp. Z014]MCL7762654.1 hypothetical protein [Polaribacter sp. Z014]
MIFIVFFYTTKQALFLYDYIEDTLAKIIPEEISYLQKYDELKKYLDNHFEIPDKTVLLVRFLEQHQGIL